MEKYVLKFGKYYYAGTYDEYGSVKVVLHKNIQLAKWFSEECVKMKNDEYGGVVMRLDIALSEYEGGD